MSEDTIFVSAGRVEIAGVRRGETTVAHIFSDGTFEPVAGITFTREEMAIISEKCNQIGRTIGSLFMN